MGANINQARDKQLSTLKKIMSWAGILFSTLGAAPVIAIGPLLSYSLISPRSSSPLVLTFVFVGLFTKPSLQSLFTALALLNMMRMVFFMLPAIFQQGSQLLVRSPSPSSPSPLLLSPDLHWPHPGLPHDPRERAPASHQGFP